MITMAEPKLAKWQKALTHWELWSETTGKLRCDINSQYDLNHLVSHAKIVLPRSEEREITSLNDIIPIGNEEYLTLDRIYDRTWAEGNIFIRDKIGLKQSKQYFWLLLNFWMFTVLPEFVVDPQNRLNIPDEVLSDLFDKPIWTESRTIGRGKNKRIVDSIQWFRDEITVEEVAANIRKLRFPSQESLTKISNIGRPRSSISDSSYLEGIVCFLLNKRQKMKQAAIAGIFGWKTHKDTYGDLMSSTVRSRVKLVRELFAPP